MGLSSVFIALRVFCKFKTHRGLWWDDHILIISWVCTPILSPFTSSWLTHREAASARRQLSHHRLGTAGLRKAHLGHRPGQSRSARLAGKRLGQPVHPGGRPEQDIVRCDSHPHHRRLHQGSNLDRPGFNEQLHVVVGAFSVDRVQPAPQDLGSLRTRDVLEPVCRDRISCLFSWYIYPQGISASSHVADRDVLCLAISGLGDAVLSLLPWRVLFNLQIKRKEKIGVGFAMSMGIL